MAKELERELREVESGAYKVSRAAGDARAFESGGVPRLARRLVRRKITRSIFGLLRGKR